MRLIDIRDMLFPVELAEGKGKGTCLVKRPSPTDSCGM